MMRLALFVCTFGGVGYSPVAPGTAGSAAGLVVYVALRLAGASPVAEALIIALIIVAGVWSGTMAERHFGTTDPGPGVIDEVAGMLVTLYALPAGWTIAIAGFFLFRVLDVFKPFPAQQFERFHGGLGMMADDLMVAIYSNLLLRVALWLLPGVFFV
jgi:phosphatidylglycerophosphatase A